MAALIYKLIEKDDFMISKTKVAIAILLVAASQPYTYADTPENVLSVGGGTVFNGLNFNGLGLNGINLNGWEMNGFRINGWQINGINLNGWSLNGLALQKEESVLNPLVSLAAEPLTK
jgi:hypothetical protein